jgi:hypothetical protein
LQASEITSEPGGYTGEHHHVGPGIRYVASGTLTFEQEGKTTTYKTGDYVYEAGNSSKHINLRTRIKRLVRRTICFSKTERRHDLVLGLFIHRYEFGRPI